MFRKSANSFCALMTAIAGTLVMLSGCAPSDPLAVDHIQWSITYDDDSDAQSVWSRMTPIWTGDTIVFQGRQGFRALEAVTGRELWRTKFTGDLGLCELITDAETIACVDWSTDSLLFLKVSNGKLTQVATPDSLARTPLATTSHGVVILTYTGDEVFATSFNANGNQVWSQAVGLLPPPDDSSSATPTQTPNPRYRGWDYYVLATKDRVLVRNVVRDSGAVPYMDTATILDAQDGSPITPQDDQGYNAAIGFGYQLADRGLVIDSAENNQAQVYLDGSSKVSTIDFEVNTGSTIRGHSWGDGLDASCRAFRPSKAENSPLVLCRTGGRFSSPQDDPATELVAIDDDGSVVWRTMSTLHGARLGDVSSNGIGLTQDSNGGAAQERYDAQTGETVAVTCLQEYLGPGLSSYYYASSVGLGGGSKLYGCDAAGTAWLQDGVEYGTLQMYGNSATYITATAFYVLK